MALPRPCPLWFPPRRRWSSPAPPAAWAWRRPKPWRSRDGRPKNERSSRNDVEEKGGKIPWKIHEHVWKIHEKPWKTRKILWKTMKNEVLKWSGCYFTVKISWNHVKLAVLCGLCIRNQASIKMFEFSSGELKRCGRSFFVENLCVSVW